MTICWFLQSIFSSRLLFPTWMKKKFWPSHWVPRKKEQFYHWQWMITFWVWLHTFLWLPTNVIYAVPIHYDIPRLGLLLVLALGRSSQGRLLWLFLCPGDKSPPLGVLLSVSLSTSSPSLPWCGGLEICLSPRSCWDVEPILYNLLSTGVFVVAGSRL